MKKHIIAFLIGLAGLINAQVATPPSLGDGTESNPYQIATLENLYWIAADTLNFHNHYIQTADIDAAETRNWFGGEGWIPIGDMEHPFTGCYDGYYIYDLFINRPLEDNIGLFGVVNGGTIVLLYLIDSDITGGNYTGTIAGKLENSELRFVLAEKGSLNGSDYIGGLSGYISSSTIEKSYSSASVTGNNFTGGVTGFNTDSSVVTVTTSFGTVSGKSYTGGFSGMNSNSTIENSYSRSIVNGTDIVGGLLGEHKNGGSVNFTYSAGSVSGDSNTGGLIGVSDSSSVSSSFWDINASSQTVSSGGIGKTTGEMQTTATYLDVGWDFAGETENGTEDIWVRYEYNYPFIGFNPSGIEDNDSEIPQQVALYQNYPNPFNPVTTIKFSIPATQNVKLTVYNSNGQLVSELLRGKMEAGNHTVMFNGDKLNSGIYFYRLDADGKNMTNKMLLIK